LLERPAGQTLLGAEFFMNDQKKNNTLVVTLVTVLVLLMAGMMLMNHWLRREANKIKDYSKKQPVFAVAVQDNPSSAAGSQETMQGEVIRRARVVRGEEYIENIFYIGNTEIARFKESHEGQSDFQGTIPDGKVNFVDEYKNTRGEEYYKYGKRHGESRSYYADGKLKAEEQYRLGRLMLKKEYYNDGLLRFEVDYEDARSWGDNKEVGVGKLYHRDGTLKFEWHITRSESPGFKKSYNKDGSLRHAAYYDDFGRLIEEKTH